MKKEILKLLAFSASLLSAIGSGWIFATTDWGAKDGLIIGIGFYLAGKACFLGPMLWLVGNRILNKEGA
ncbi:hypothetical protein Ga0100231_015510 [Opitutaceae bacterium TAV4]|nr:hypothetical protein Ga0100231_015510 [Opitutaceae bacterium TAV4]RRJ99666.1 hypothetical protein Ga0100230_016340 [Opitutaceae bacterium TAV3]